MYAADKKNTKISGMSFILQPSRQASIMLYRYKTVDISWSSRAGLTHSHKKKRLIWRARCKKLLLGYKRRKKSAQLGISLTSRAGDVGESEKKIVFTHLKVSVHSLARTVQCVFHVSTSHLSSARVLSFAFFSVDDDGLTTANRKKKLCV